MSLFLAILLLAVGIIIRSLGTPFLLLLGTALIGVAIAFGNVLLPSFIKLKFPLQLGLMTGVFTVSMNLSAGIGAGISYPIADGTSYGWQGALGFSGYSCNNCMYYFVTSGQERKNKNRLSWPLQLM